MHQGLTCPEVQGRGTARKNRHGITASASPSPVQRQQMPWRDQFRQLTTEPWRSEETSMDPIMYSVYMYVVCCMLYGSRVDESGILTRRSQTSCNASSSLHAYGTTCLCYMLQLQCLGTLRASPMLIGET